MPITRASSRVYTSADGIIARAGRAAEDPNQMTAPATISRMARYCIKVLKANPNLTEKQAVKAATLLLRADMQRLARKSAEARRPHITIDGRCSECGYLMSRCTCEVLDATGLEDCGSDGVDAD